MDNTLNEIYEELGVLDMMLARATQKFIDEACEDMFEEDDDRRTAA